MPDPVAELRGSFERFRDEIDSHNDKRERLIKASRDITALSKKLIFHLHRFSLERGDAATSSQAALLGEAHTKLQGIYAQLSQLAQEEGLVSDHDRPSVAMLRYERYVGDSIEEMVEAASFLHFLEHRTILPYEQMQRHFCAPDGRIVVHISPLRYILGLCDLNGELMRFAIDASASPDPMRIIHQVLHVQRTIYYTIEPMSPLLPDIRKKQSVTLSSIRKVENAAYTISVRSFEYGHDPQFIRDFVRRDLDTVRTDDYDTM
ncbi:translin family protein [Malassezia restricta]|uniref:translin family protein n=1 Tax=Malassezia restricta TaxID=76775 RepID=UPI000DD11B4E|nr:translin family protein [Malassezia restricta]AXA49179.1 translin family protein [Malassezia restricta]